MGESDGAIAEQLPKLLATATALTGAPETAADLAGEVLVLARRPRSGVDLVDPEPGLRNLLVIRYAARRPVQPAGPGPVGPPGSDGSSQPEESDEVAGIIAGLDRLTRPQRAALLLSFRDRLTYAEIAGILDRPVGKVAQSVADAQTQLNATPYAIAAAFERLGRFAPEPAEARAAGLRFSRRRKQRRRRVSALVTAAIMVIALAVALPTVILPRLFPPPVRASAEWAFGYRVVPPEGFHVGERFLQRDLDQTYLTDESNSEGGCSIEASAASPVPVAPPGSTSVTVNGRPGWIATPEETGTKELTWLYAPGAVAKTSCDERVDPEGLLLEIARGVTFTQVPLPLPFRLATLPEGYQVSAVGTSLEVSPGEPAPVSALLLMPMGSVPDEDDGGIYLLMPGDGPEGEGAQKVQVNGKEVFVTTQAGIISVCRPEQNTTACLSASFDTDSATAEASAADVRRLVDLAGELSFATNVSDQSTWIDARESLPR